MPTESQAEDLSGSLYGTSAKCLKNSSQGPRIRTFQFGFLFVFYMLLPGGLILQIITGSQSFIWNSKIKKQYKAKAFFFFFGNFLAAKPDAPQWEAKILTRMRLFIVSILLSVNIYSFYYRL